MAQYFGLKKKHKDAILLFRVGDFYETFGKDAIQASEALGIILTSRNNGGSHVELAGFPYHSLNQYLPRLVKAGFRVAICEQLEKPSKEKKIVKRGVTELITPGITIDESLLDNKKNNYLASIYPAANKVFAISFLDVSTGEFLVTEGSSDVIKQLIQNYHPSEIIFPKSKEQKIQSLIIEDFYLYGIEDWVFSAEFAVDRLEEHFPEDRLKGFGVYDLNEGKIAAGAILHYLDITENKNLNHLKKISRIQSDQFVWLDQFTIRNLELVHTNHNAGIPLISIIDKTLSSMGARLMRRWLLMPLVHVHEIRDRHHAVAYLLENTEIADSTRETLKGMIDFERVISKVVSEKIIPREVKQLEYSLQKIIPLSQLLHNIESPLLSQIGKTLDPCSNLLEIINKTLTEEPPTHISKGNTIKEGCDADLDHYRHISKNAKDLLLDIQTLESEQTGIANLKIGFNNVFGYYLEVTNKYKDKGLVPEHWVRKQTLTNAERYITDELKQLEEKILASQEKILEIEGRIFQETLTEILDYIPNIQKNAQLLAALDCLQGFSYLAAKNNYCKPDMNEGFAIDIEDGRHPVIEQHLDIGDHYIPNDTFLDNETQQILMITGPNMSGKSAVLRQTALICLLAQMGSFVPAKSASLGITDKIFTRVGASDNISSGESTFMVEMIETASIMNNLSERSLILLDEIGRGTSTYDGISIAWSLAEYLHNHPSFKAKTLFATHYHELNDLADSYPRIKNFNIATKEIGQKVIFLRKLVQGGSKHSFGIHVAKMAGMPPSIVKRASAILKQLEQKHIHNQDDKSEIQSSPEHSDWQSIQLNMFSPENEKGENLVKIIEGLDINSMTPIDCMLKLHELYTFLEKGE